MADVDKDLTTQTKVEGEEEGKGPEPEGEERGDERREREEWFYRSRLDEHGRFPHDLILNASRQRRLLERRQHEESQGQNGPPPPLPPGPAGSVNWTPIGPSVIGRGQATGRPPVSGRITALAVGPSGLRAYAGAANGGLWLTSDGGGNWAPLDDYLISPTTTSGREADSLAVGAIAVRFGASAATDTVYVGSGDPATSGDSYWGIGILSSPNGGATWNPVEATNLAGKGIFRIVIDPDNPARVFAATEAGIYQRPLSPPYTTWTQITTGLANASGSASDLVVVGSGTTKSYYAAFWNDQVYTSADGASWTAVTGLPSFPGRIAVAAGESSPGTLYVLTQNGQLYRRDAGTLQLVSNVPAAVVGQGQGGYDLVLGVDPTTANVVYIAGDAVWDGSDWNLPFYRGTLGAGPPFSFGSNNNSDPNLDPTWIGRAVHADAHTIAFALNSGGTAHVGSDVWIGTDGGIFRSTASGALNTWSPRNTGLAITQMTYIAQRPDTDAVVFGGCQDNGNLRFWGEPAWYESPEGDGGGVAIDPNDQYQVMRQYVRAGSWYPPTTLANFSPGLYSCSDGGVSGIWPGVSFPPITAATTAQKTAANAESQATNFYTRIGVTPPGVSPTLAAFGTNRVWITPDWGSSWVTLPSATNPYSPATPNAGQDVLDGNAVETVVFASGTRLLAATPRNIYRFDKTGPTTWTRTQIPVPATPATWPSNYYITALAVHDATAGSFYVALGRSGVDHVWYYDGSTWHSAGLSKATLDVPMHAVAVDPDHPDNIYVGTDVGCWKGTKTGATSWTWSVLSQGLPESAIVDLAVHQRARLLRAATHGRGVWEIPLDATTGTDPDLYVRVNYADAGRLPGGSRYPWVENAPDPTRKNFSTWHWMSSDIKVRRSSLANPDPLNTPPDYLDFAVNIDDYVSSQDVETADVTGMNRVYVQVHNRALTPVPGSNVRVLLLVTDAYAGLPALPANYANHVNNGDPPASWIPSTSPWKVADPASPYKSPPGMVDVRTPGVVEFDVDFGVVFPTGLPAGHDHVCAAALVTSTVPSNQLSGATSSMDQLTVTDKLACHRNLHLVALSAKPAPPGGRLEPAPETFVIKFANARAKDELVDIVLEREDFAGHLSLMLSRLERGPERLDGFERIERRGLETELRGHLGRWLGEAGELLEELGERVEQAAQRLRGEHVPPDELELPLRRPPDVDRGVVYVAGKERVAAIRGVALAAGGETAAAVTVRAPAGARPGDRWRFHLLQRGAAGVAGGSTYVVAVTEERAGSREAAGDGAAAGGG